MNVFGYEPPVDRLLTYGDCREMRDWPDYPVLGIGPEHIPDLIRMATDDRLHDLPVEDEGRLPPEVWAPVHAWRTLAQLRAESAVEPLAGLLDRADSDEGDDWVMDELPDVFGLLGPAAIPVLSAYLADASHGLYGCVTAANGLAEIAKQHPERRSECVAAITNRVAQPDDADPERNGFLIADLITLQAVESASVIEQAFARDAVELSIAGDWEDVQIALGLRTERETPPPRYNLLPGLLMPEPQAGESVHLAARQNKAKAKRKRKEVAKARRKNRKKK